jgi:hypothetical protein
MPIVQDLQDECHRLADRHKVIVDADTEKIDWLLHMNSMTIPQLVHHKQGLHTVLGRPIVSY